MQFVWYEVNTCLRTSRSSSVDRRSEALSATAWAQQMNSECGISAINQSLLGYHRQKLSLNCQTRHLSLEWIDVFRIRSRYGELHHRGHQSRIQSVTLPTTWTASGFYHLKSWDIIYPSLTVRSRWFSLFKIIDLCTDVKSLVVKCMRWKVVDRPRRW